MSSKKSSEKKMSSKKESDTGDITTLILRDHKPIKELIQILKNPEGTLSKKQPAYAEFEILLTSHAKAEEESLYIYLKEVDELRTEGLEGDTEHEIAEQLMSEINDSVDDNDMWMAKVKVLAEIVDHHVKEEEKEVLKEVRKEFDSDQRKEIGELYIDLLAKYREEFENHTKYNSNAEVGAEYV